MNILKDPAVQIAGGIAGTFLAGVGIAAAIIFLQPEKVIAHSKVVTMEVARVELRSKTNSVIDLKVVGLPTVYRDQHVWCSKREAETIRIGSRWDVTVQDYKRGDRYGTELVGLRSICRPGAYQ